MVTTVESVAANVWIARRLSTHRHSMRRTSSGKTASCFATLSGLLSAVLRGALRSLRLSFRADSEANCGKTAFVEARGNAENAKHAEFSPFKSSHPTLTCSTGRVTATSEPSAPKPQLGRKRTHSVVDWQKGRRRESRLRRLVIATRRPAARPSEWPPAMLHRGDQPG